VPLLAGETDRVFGRGALAEAAVRPFGVVLLPPGFDALLRLGDRSEMMLVQALVPQLAIETLDEAVLDGMPRPEEVESDPMCA